MRKSILFIVILFLSVSLVFPMNVLSYPLFPPGTEWQEVASNGVTSATITDSWIVLTARGTGAYVFAGTKNASDLTNVSYLSIDWKGDWISWNPAFYRGNITFGISTSQMDTSYDKYIAMNSSDFNTTSYLDVSDYYGDYYIKVGVNVSLAGTLDDMTLWVYNVSAENYSFSAPLPITTTTTTTATLRGYLIDDGGNRNSKCGFWYGNETPTQALIDAGFAYNVTSSGTYYAGQTFTYPITGLTSAEYYYVKTWVYNGHSFNITNGYVLTLSAGVNNPYVKFLDDLWEGNSTIGNDNTTQTFLQTGGIWEHLNILFRDPDGANFWGPATGFPGGTLTSIDSYENYPKSSYRFTMYNSSDLIFKFDNGTSTEENFITNPTVPTNLNASSIGPNSVNVSWINAPVPANTNYSVYIRYKTGSPPTSLTDGTYGANESTNNYTIISGLEGDTTYYFSAWSYVNASGSPVRHAFSSSYATASNTTTGGNYIFWVRYENESYSNNYLVNLSQYSNHRLDIYYYSGHDRVNFSDGSAVSTVDGAFWNISNGSFNLTLTESPRFFVFYWNDSNGSDMYCMRTLVPTTGERNITFYIRTNCYVFGETTGDLNSTNTLLKYHYSYLDSTGLFRYPNNPYCQIYCFNSNNERLVIHSEFFDHEGKTHPWLVYDNRYYQGVHCDVLSYDRIGIAPATDDVDQEEIRIPVTLDRYYTFYDLIELDYAWGADGFYVNYQDTTSSTNWVNFTVYYFLNGSFVHTENETGLNLVNFSFTQAEGCNSSIDYMFVINTSLNGNVDENYEGFYQSGKIPMYAGMSPITSNSTLDYYLQLIFGKSPLYYYGNEDVFVPWAYILIFLISFIVLCTFGRLSAFLGAVGVGITLVFSGIAIAGVQTLFSNYAWWEGPVLVVIGAFVVALSIIALMGGVEK